MRNIETPIALHLISSLEKWCIDRIGIVGLPTFLFYELDMYNAMLSSLGLQVFVSDDAIQDFELIPFCDVPSVLHVRLLR